MKIGVIRNVRFENEPNPQPKEPAQENFRGIWQRLGQNYLDADKYCAGVFYGFVDGKKLAVNTDKMGRNLIELENNGMTVKEGKLAWDFLFEGKETIDGSIAVQKLRNFMLTKVSNLKHNVMFLEKEDSALVTAERKPIRLGIVNEKLREFAYKNKLLKKEEDVITRETQTVPTSEELLKQLSENGVA